MRALRGIGGVILDGERLALPLGIVRDGQLYGVQHRHRALGRRVLLFLIILVITIVQMKLQKKWVYSENGGDDK